MNYRLEAFLNRFRPVLTGEIVGKVVVLDNRIVRKLKLRNCIVAYGGGSLDADGMYASHCRFTFFGAAGATLKVMKHYDQSSPDLIANTFPGALCYDRIGRPAP
jgi:hypothetical protein